MPYTDVNNLGSMEDIQALIATRQALPRAMTRARKQEDIRRGIDVAGTLAAIIDAELAIDPYGRSPSYLLSGPQRISSSEAHFIDWFLHKKTDQPWVGTLKQARECYD